MSENPINKLGKKNQDISNKEENEKVKTLCKKNKKKQECIELKNIEYKSMLLNHKSVKKSTKFSNIDIDEFLKKESKLNGCLSWNKLDKSMKIKKLMLFAESWLKNQPDNISVRLNGKKITEKLKEYLNTALQRKKLLKKTEVEYDLEKEIIVKIPGLEYREKREIFIIKNNENKKSSIAKLAPHKKISTKKNVKKGKKSTNNKKNGTTRKQKKKTNLLIKDIGKNTVKKKKVKKVKKRKEKNENK